VSAGLLYTNSQDMQQYNTEHRKEGSEVDIMCPVENPLSAFKICKILNYQLFGPSAPSENFEILLINNVPTHLSSYKSGSEGRPTVYTLTNAPKPRRPLLSSPCFPGEGCGNYD
jgi:hypothetical protein